MKTKRKMLPVLLLAAALMTMTAACGNAPAGTDGVVADDGKEEPGGPATPTKEPATPSKEPETPAKEPATPTKEPETPFNENDIEAEAKAAGQTIVYAATPQELKDALKSNTMIVLEGKDYTFDYGLDVQKLENMTIHGTEGTRVMTTSRSDDIVSFTECKGIKLRNLVMGHDVPVESECTMGVVYAYTSELTLVNCDIFGCGLIGITAGESTITAKNTTIRDCECGLMDFFNSGAVFENCTFSGSGNEYAEAAITMYLYEKSGEILFSGCKFTDNKNKKLYICMDSKADKEIQAITLKDCSYSGNVWGDTAP